MTRREIRKTRPERRSRIEAERLESRNLLSSLGAVGTPGLEVHHPYIKPHHDVMVGHVIPPGPQTISAKLTPDVMAGNFHIGGGIGGGKLVADVKNAPPANWVADCKVAPPATIVADANVAPQILTGLLHPPNPCVVSGAYQTSVWGGTELSSLRGIYTK
jgi:hypothetical protein